MRMIPLRFSSAGCFISAIYKLLWCPNLSSYQPPCPPIQSTRDYSFLEWTTFSATREYFWYINSDFDVPCYSRAGPPGGARNKFRPRTHILLHFLTCLRPSTGCGTSGYCRNWNSICPLPIPNPHTSMTAIFTSTTSANTHLFIPSNQVYPGRCSGSHSLNPLRCRHPIYPSSKITNSSSTISLFRKPC